MQTSLYDNIIYSDVTAAAIHTDTMTMEYHITSQTRTRTHIILVCIYIYHVATLAIINKRNCVCTRVSFNKLK